MRCRPVPSSVARVWPNNGPTDSAFVLLHGYATLVAMLIWVPDDILRFAIYDGMRTVRLTGAKRERLPEEDRDRLTAGIVERFQLCQWRVVRREIPPHSTFGPPLSK